MPVRSQGSLPGFAFVYLPEITVYSVYPSDNNNIDKLEGTLYNIPPEVIKLLATHRRDYMLTVYNELARNKKFPEDQYRPIEELRLACHHLKDKKAPGPRQIPPEVIKRIDQTIYSSYTIS